MTFLESERIILRAVEERDLESLWEAAQTPGLTDGLEWVPPPTKAILREHILSESMSDKFFPLVITDKQGQFLGRAFLKNISHRWSIGFWLLPTTRGNGYATEAASLLIQYAFEKLNAEEVYANCMPWNHKSREVLLRLGMTLNRSDAAIMKLGEKHMVEEYVLKTNM